MSLFYKCDCCGQLMHKLGADGKKRLHLDVGDQTDYDFVADNGHSSWDISEYPLIQLDLCKNCYTDICAKIISMRIQNQLADTLEEVSINGSSV